VRPFEVRPAQDLRAAFDLNGDLVIPADHERDCRVALDVGVLAGTS